MTRQPLTPEQNRVYDAVCRLIAATGYPPTYREIAHAAGLTSIATVAHHLDAIEARGWITRGAHRARAIRVLT